MVAKDSQVSFCFILCVSLSAYQNLTYFTTFQVRYLPVLVNQLKQHLLPSTLVQFIAPTQVVSFTTLSYYGATRPFTLKTTFFFLFPVI